MLKAPMPDAALPEPVPKRFVLMSVVVPLMWSRRKTSCLRLRSFATKSAARLTKSTFVPSALRKGVNDAGSTVESPPSPPAAVPNRFTLTSLVTPSCMSRTKTSGKLFVSGIVTRFVAWLLKAI